MANTFIDIGKIVPVFTGDYSPSRVYEFNDLVRSNNIIYWHVERDSTVGVQPPAAGVWMKLLTSGGEGGGGSNVHVDAIQTEGTHIADITVDGEVVALYAPEGAMGEPVTVSETETGDILIKGQGGAGTLPPASSTALGGVKADPKQASDTQPVRIGQDGKLWTANTGGGEVDRSNELIDVLNTYYTNRSIGFVYSASNTPIKGTYVDGSNNIDCSTFIILGIMGIPFEDSPYNHKALQTGHQDWAFNPVPYAIDTAAELCEMLTYSGCRLKWEKHDNITLQDLKDAGVRSGDILFISNEANGRYMDITHTSIIWDIDATYPILEVTSSTNVVQRGSVPVRGQNIVAICRPVVNENATARYMAGCEDFVRAHSGGGSATDVQINGVSITEDGVANIPVASTTQLGVAKAGTGISVGNDGGLFIQPNWDSQLSDRANRTNQAVTLGFVDKAVTAVLTDGKAPALTDAQKAQAQSWLGVSGGGGSDAWILDGTIEPTEDVTQVLYDLQAPTKEAMILSDGNITSAGNKYLYINKKSLYVMCGGNISANHYRVHLQMVGNKCLCEYLASANNGDGVPRGGYKIIDDTEISSFKITISLTAGTKLFVYRK